MRSRTYYEILEVAPDASPAVISAARRTLLATLKKHPDLGGDARDAVLINEACDILLDPERRAAYDRTLVGARGCSSGAEARFAERRRAPRHEIDATVSFCLDHDLRWHPARVRDVSILGVRIRTHAPLAVGQHLVIAPSNLAASAIHGTVKWARMFHPSVFERVYEAGIEFADQITDVEQRLSV